MSNKEKSKVVDILLVEDNPGDVRLVIEGLKESKIINKLNVVEDGVEALAYLKKEGKYEGKTRPDLILLDLNLPKMDGREVLDIIKKDELTRRIPVVILTTSETDEDILKSYELHANCFITKPIDIEQFIKVVNAIGDFWFSIVKLPTEL